MTQATFFNLLVNSSLSMLVGLMIVSLAVWFFRIQTGPWKIFLFSLPFLKIIYDFFRGLPPDSVLLSAIDPFNLPPKHQVLQIGIGTTYWGPKFDLIFSVQDTNGKYYAASIGDYALLWVNRTIGINSALYLLTAALSVSAFFVIRRLFLFVRFEQQRRSDRKISQSLSPVAVAFRQIDVYASTKFNGTPFTGGVLNPYICFPAVTYDKLSPEERQAVLAHEIGHVRKFDLIFTCAIQFLGDFFWFIPGYRWLSRKIDHMREMTADQFAVKFGANPAALASALVKLRELQAPQAMVLYSAFFREKSLLKARIERLIGTAEKPSRFGWNSLWLRSLVTVWIFTAVMLATFGGNHRTANLSNPEWFDTVLRYFGFI